MTEETSQFGRLKMLNHMPTLKSIGRGEKVPPITLELDPDDRCNHSCYFCYYADDGTGARTQQSLDKDIMMHTLKESAELGIKAVTFTGGGEPLMNPHTPEAMIYARELGMDVGLVTNGSLFNETSIDAVIQSCQFVRISLDGGSEESHATVHGIKNPRYGFTTIMKNLETLAARKGEGKEDLVVGLGYLVDTNNIASALALAEQARAIGLDYVQFRPLYFDGKPEWTAPWESAQRTLAKAKGLETDSFKVHIITDRADEITMREKPYDSCLAHALLAIVGATGKAYFCSPFRGLEKAEIGDLREQSLSAIWYGSKRMELLESIEVDKCPNCRFQTHNKVLYDFTGKSDEQIDASVDLSTVSPLHKNQI
tara:strand:- start:15197 stop:16303 length:1107 start_codon:yes stop_codon:yes gene_type:complete